MIYAAYVPVTHYPRAEAMPSAYELFQSGMDTDQIARLLWQREALVLRAINIERSRRLGLIEPYAVRS